MLFLLFLTFFFLLSKLTTQHIILLSPENKTVIEKKLKALCMISFELYFKKILGQGIGVKHEAKTMKHLNTLPPAS